MSAPTNRLFASGLDRTGRSPVGSSESTHLADLLDRVLDKGIVIAGDITLAVADIDLLTLKIRLLVASVDKAQEIGINWWQCDPFLSSRARQVQEERDLLLNRLDRLEARLSARTDGRSEATAEKSAELSNEGET
jgi:hypothetical protein